MYCANEMKFLFLFVVVHTVSSLNVHLICHSHDDVGWLSTRGPHSSRSELRSSERKTCSKVLFERTELFLTVRSKRTELIEQFF
jgi:hypothetical protein